MKNKVYSITRSSKDGQSLSRTVKGILTAFIPVILVIAQANSYDIDKNVLVDIVTAITALVSAGLTIYGLVMKVLNRNQSKEERF